MIKPEKTTEVNSFLRKNLVRVRMIFGAGAEMVRMRTKEKAGENLPRLG